MKRNQVNAILVNQTRRRNTVFAFICTIIVVFMMSLSFFIIYTQRDKENYVKYDESSNIDYNVYLKDNSYFSEDYLGANNQYIASLIDYINADFNYKLSLEEKYVEYKYSYRVEAEVNVKDSNTDYSLYNTKEELINEKEKTTSLSEVTIKENINIDYNHYNNLIKQFVNVYGLNNAESTLTINMYVNVVGSCEEFTENQEKESVMSLTIPLTTKTMAIELSDNLVNTENNVMQCDSEYNNSGLFLFLGISCAIADLVFIFITIRYEIRTRTAENIYERELKKILNNYSSYIQTINNNFDLKGYQLVKLDNFTDLLEIRDTIRQPILMQENDKKDGAYFIIPSNTKILYVYRLKVSDIEKEIQSKSNKSVEEF